MLQVPTVLVVGATGEMGRVVVRKLLLRGEELLPDVVDVAAIAAIAAVAAVTVVVIA